MDINQYLELARESLVEKGTLYISVWVKTNAPFTKWKELLEEHNSDGNINYHLKLDVRATPEKGKANFEIYRFLADEFKVPKEKICIVAGVSDTRKVIMIKI